MVVNRLIDLGQNIELALVNETRNIGSVCKNISNFNICLQHDKNSKLIVYIHFIRFIKWLLQNKGVLSNNISFRFYKNGENN